MKRQYLRRTQHILSLIFLPNHDGDLSRAKDLIWLAKEAGADCAKFQHFIANKIVSDVGFTGELSSVSHQSEWKSSVVKFTTNITLKESGAKSYI